MSHMPDSYPGGLVISPRPGPALRVWILDRDLVVVPLHFSLGDGRSVPCGWNLPCTYCAIGSARRWKMYGSCITHHRSYHAVTITPAALAGLLAGMDEQDTFRGLQISLKRVSEGRQSRVVGIAETRIQSGALPMAHDIMPILTRLYGPLFPRMRVSPATFRQGGAEPIDSLFSPEGPP